MVKWKSLAPNLGQQPTTPALKVTFSAMETAHALVKLMKNGLGIHLLVNVCEWYFYTYIVVRHSMELSLRKDP